MRRRVLDLSQLAAAPIVRVWRHRDFALFMSGIGPYYVTGWMQRVAVGWLAWEMTASPGWLGAIAAADLAPMLLFAPLAGALVDRWDPIKQMKLSLVVVIAHAVDLAALTMAGMMTIELLLVLTLVQGSAMPVYNAARQMIVPATVPRTDFASAVSLDSSLFHGSRFIGPMIAAFMIRDLGVGATLFAHVAGCLFLTLQVLRMNIPPPQRKASTGNLMHDVVEGIAYVRSQHGIYLLFVMMTAVSLSVRPLQEFLPGFAGGIFKAGPNGLAWLTSSMGVGAMIGATWLAMRGHTRGLTDIVVLCVLGLGIATLGFVATDQLMTGVAFASLAGFSLTVMATGISALTQTSVSDDMRGRVMSLFAMIYRGVPAVGSIAIGLVAEQAGLRTAFALAAIVCVLVWVWVARRRHTIDAAIRRDGR